MNRSIGFAIVPGLLILSAAACSTLDPITAPSPSSGSADFSVYASMGTSVTAGWQSGGLVDRHQMHSYAVLFARQAGATSFTIPSVSADGKPALLRIVSLSPLIVSNAGRTAGSPTNAAQATAYHNMAVPSAVLYDVANSTYYYSGLPRPTFPFEDIVRHRGTILSEVASLAPTFVSLEYGASEVLGPAVQGSGTVTPDPTTFAAILHGTLAALAAAAPGAKLALLTVPDVTTIPYFTTFPPYTVNATTGVPVALLGPGGTTLGAGDFVLLAAGPDLAAGKGFPVGAYNYVNPAAGGTGAALEDGEVLSVLEQHDVTAAVNGYNAAIRSEASARGAALVDFHGLLQTAATVGLRYQGTDYSPDFITGGLFSLDGVHPTDLAHGFICNAMIDAVNATFGARIPQLSLGDAASITASRLRPEFGEKKLYPVIENAPEFYRQMFGRMTAPALAGALRARR